MSDKYRGHSRSPLESHEPKKLKREEVRISNVFLGISGNNFCFIGK